jgi:hemolysin III
MTTHTLNSARPAAGPAVLPACPAKAAIADLREELVNTLTHGVGALGSLGGFAVLLWLALRTGQTWQVAGSVVYGMSLVLLYSASTVYHGVRCRQLKAMLRVADHIGIYLLIAGTFTPFALAAAPRHGLTPLIAGWAVTLAGIAVKVLRAKRESLLVSTIFYVATVTCIGWLGLDTMLSNHRLAIWLILGAMFYGQGLWFFMQNRRYYHSIWHLFVIAGSACHYGAVVLLVLGG